MNVKSPLLASLILLFVCFVWGGQFVLVDLAIAKMSVYGFNFFRFLIAALALLPFCWLDKDARQPFSLLPLLKVGLGLGLLLFVAFSAQTIGLLYTSVSNAGFITGMNVPLVPLVGLLLFRTKVGLPVCLGVLVSTLGLYFLTVGDKLLLNQGDALVLLCAACFAIHIVLTGRYAQRFPVLPFAVVQMAAVAIYSAVVECWLNPGHFSMLEGSSVSILELLQEPVIYAAILIGGLLGSGFAIWAQTACQRLLAPHKVALIFSTEPIFAYLAAVLFLGEMLGGSGLLGGGLIVAGILIAELGDKKLPSFTRTGA